MIDFAGIPFKNPVVAAAGTAGYGLESRFLADPSRLGAVTLKALTLEPRPGNPMYRITETEAGLINSVGLQNDGLAYFMERIAPELPRIGTRVIANLAGNQIEDYVALVRAMNTVAAVDLIELNVSCPNVHGGRVEFGSDPALLEKLVQACAAVATKPLMPKLSPNVTSITDMAKACENGGASAVSLVNTFLGMQINVASRRPSIARVTGGYSGPGIKPIALRMVYQVCRAVKIPVLGLGGIRNTDDALEFLLAGATLVGIGAAGSFSPRVPVRVARGLEAWVRKQKIDWKGIPLLLREPEAP
ncbi:MAG: dihydroorotate dehydrogenase [Spirochaetes bacterium]|nr:dihydroorotate dehydrogenase [Spirochaetota bacterium]